jgi:hypothetical protein
MARDFTPTPHRHLRQCRFLAELLTGVPPPAAASRVGVPLKTLYSWRRRNPVFRRAWDKARLTARFPPFPSLAQLDNYIGTPDLLLPGESDTLVLRSPGDRPWIELTSICRADGEIEHIRRDFQPTAEERQAAEARWRHWEVPRRRPDEPETGGSER